MTLPARSIRRKPNVPELCGGDSANRLAATDGATRPVASRKGSPVGSRESTENGSAQESPSAA